MSTAPKYRKAPDGEWLGYPYLTQEDIQHESFRSTKYVTQSLVNNRKGRIHIIMDHDLYQRFLNAVCKKFGNKSAFNVEKAALEAIKAWTEGIEST